MSDTDIKCQGLCQLSKYRLYNHRPGISLVFICHVGKPAVLGQHSHWIKQICSIWHQVAACHLKVFFYDKSTGSLNVLYVMWDCLVLNWPQTCDDDDTSPFHIPPLDFSSISTSFWIIILVADARLTVLTLIPRGKYGSNNNKSGLMRRLIPLSCLYG